MQRYGLPLLLAPACAFYRLGSLSGALGMVWVSARPFDLKFTRTDLNRLLARIRQHDRHAPHPLAA